MVNNSPNIISGKFSCIIISTEISNPSQELDSIGIALSDITPENILITANQVIQIALLPETENPYGLLMEFSTDEQETKKYEIMPIIDLVRIYPCNPTKFIYQIVEFCGFSLD